ncbi:MAG: short-chain dehydrogenase [Gemmatimonadetes bacterium]|nr:MAG: short-chain dehydrogenase [Gemmatimonadota bacterium]
MELADRTVMLLGGSGLVGHAVARRVLAASPPPRRLVLVALFEDEVRAAARALEPYRGGVTIDVEWGNVFMPAPVARLDMATVMAKAEHRALVLGDLLGDLTDAVLERNLLFQLLVRYKPDAVVDSINTATAFAYQDVFQSARDLLDRAKNGGAPLDRAAIEQHLLRLPMPPLIRHAQIITEALRRAGTQAYVKIGTSGTGGMGFNIPYTHSEERPSATLLTKSAIAGAHTMLLFLLGRTPDAPVTVEIKPTATIAWREVAHGPVRRKGKPIPLVDCDTPVRLQEAFAPGATPWRDLGRPLDGVYIDVGENGLFARDEFETVTALGQMEFITPEEVADYVILELQGRPTGKDIVAALDASTAGPTYRAGVLRRNAVGRLRALEDSRKSRGVAYEMLGPPRLTKLLYEAYLCRQLCRNVRVLAGSKPRALADAAWRLLEADAALRQQIISVGLPIVAPDGKTVYRGSIVVVAPEPDRDPLSVAPRGWVDLRPEQFGVWITRAGAMVRDAEVRASGPQSSGSDVDWNAIDPDDTIEPSRFATWVFTVEDKGTRIKR